MEVLNPKIPKQYPFSDVKEFHGLSVHGYITIYTSTINRVFDGTKKFTMRFFSEELGATIEDTQL